MGLRPAAVDVATRRRLAFGSTLGASALLVLAIVLLVNWLGFRHYQRWDWTRSHLYTLSPKTLSILRSLDRDVSAVVVMSDQAPVFEPTKELLTRYAAASPRIQVSYVDPQRNPARAQQLGQKYGITRQAVVFESGKDKRVVEATELAEYDYSGMEQGAEPQMKGFKGEQQFTSALVDLSEAKKPKVLFTTGHGEPSLDGFDERGFGRLQRQLSNDNFALEEWASLGKPQVPPDTDAVVVAGPTAPLAPPELDVLSKFLAGGGRILVMVDPSLTATGRGADTGLAGWLQGWGVQAQDDVVVDPANVLPFFGAETIFASSYGSQPIVAPLQKQRIPVVFSLARSVRAGKAPPGGSLTELVRTSPDGWGETDLDHLTRVEKGPQDVAGPVALGVALDLGGGAGDQPPPPRPSAAARGRMVVFGDSDFATNALVDQSGNASLIANTLNWMVQRQSHLAIAPKEPEQVHLSLTPQERRRNLLLVVLGLPGAALAAGIVINVRRRR